jgi:hypothetical protein
LQVLNLKSIFEFIEIEAKLFFLSNSKYNTSSEQALLRINKATKRQKKKKDKMNKVTKSGRS